LLITEVTSGIIYEVNWALVSLFLLFDTHLTKWIFRFAKWKS
jgi:hypothetical protein